MAATLPEQGTILLLFYKFPYGIFMYGFDSLYLNISLKHESEQLGNSFSECMQAGMGSELRGFEKAAPVILMGFSPKQVSPSCHLVWDAVLSSNGNVACGTTPVSSSLPTFLTL